MAKKNEAVGHWAKAADRVILAVIAEHKGCDRDVLKHLISDEYPFGERAMHPYKVWLKRVKYQLDCHFGRKQEPVKEGLFEEIWNSKIPSLPLEVGE